MKIFNIYLFIFVIFIIFIYFIVYKNFFKNNICKKSKYINIDININIDNKYKKYIYNFEKFDYNLNNILINNKYYYVYILKNQLTYYYKNGLSNAKFCKWICKKKHVKILIQILKIMNINVIIIFQMNLFLLNINIMF